MSKKSSHKFKIIGIVIIIMLLFALKEEIFFGSLHLYAAFDKANGNRVLGEAYSIKSYEANKKAAHYFQIALAEYKQELPISDEESKKIIAFIIGTHYECGRGVEQNLEEAKKWYQKSIDAGLYDGKGVLDRVKKALTRINVEKYKSKIEKKPEAMKDLNSTEKNEKSEAMKDLNSTEKNEKPEAMKDLNSTEKNEKPEQ